MLKKLLMSTALGMLLGAGVMCAEEVVVRVRPPALRHEVRPVRPGPRYVWIGGYYRWDAGARAHVWEAGRWELPPRPGVRWVAHRWERRGNGWVFVEGGWR